MSRIQSRMKAAPKFNTAVCSCTEKRSSLDVSHGRLSSDTRSCPDASTVSARFPSNACLRRTGSSDPHSVPRHVRPVHHECRGERSGNRWETLRSFKPHAAADKANLIRLSFDILVPPSRIGAGMYQTNHKSTAFGCLAGFSHPLTH